MVRRDAPASCPSSLARALDSVVDVRMPPWRTIAAATVTLVGVGAAYELWPSVNDEVGYPFSRGPLGIQTQPLWDLSADELVTASERDRQRVERAHALLEDVLTHADSLPLLTRTDVEAFSSPERSVVRHLWWAFVEPLLELDEIKHRWEHWYGIDYLQHPDLHARAYALTYASLSAQVAAGQSLLDLIAGNDRIQRLFDEAMPDVGLPAGSFTHFRGRMTRARDQSFILLGGQWYDDWIAAHLDGSEFGPLVARVRPAAEEDVDVEAILQTVQNKTETLQSEAFERWFPLQREVATWFGDTRVVTDDRRLISDAQLDVLRREVRPGDITVERPNWYLTNVGLPGFWPHAALYVGTRQDLEVFDDDEAVRELFGEPFTDHLAHTHPAAWTALGERDHAGHPHRVLEAVSEGVVAASLEHSCGADYVGVVRPRLAPVEIASAIDRALSYFGRPYDFDFDFATDDTVVCSELVMKAYEPQDDGPGLRVPFIEVAGRVAIPPTEIVRLFAAEREVEEPQLDFVYFLDGVEATQSAQIRDAEAFAASAERAKWDVLQR